MPFPLDAYAKRSIEQHFKKKGDFSWTEDFLLHVIDISGNKYDLHKAAIGLREVGTEKAVEPLRALLMYPNQDGECLDSVDAILFIYSKSYLENPFGVALGSNSNGDTYEY